MGAASSEVDMLGGLDIWAAVSSLLSILGVLPLLLGFDLPGG